MSDIILNVVFALVFGGLFLFMIVFIVGVMFDLDTPDVYWHQFRTRHERACGGVCDKCQKKYIDGKLKELEKERLIAERREFERRVDAEIDKLRKGIV